MQKRPPLDVHEPKAADDQRTGVRLGHQQLLSGSAGSCSVSQQGGKRRRTAVFTINLQTTGLSTGDDRIIEFTAMKLLPDDTALVLGPQRVFTTHPIHEGASAVNGIKAEDLKGKPTFKECARRLHRFLFPPNRFIILHAFNVPYFRPLLEAEFRRAGLEIPEHVVWHDSLAMARQQLCHGEVPNHRLPTVYTYYCDAKLPDVASSLDKAKAAHEVMLAQLRWERAAQHARHVSSCCSAASQTCKYLPV